MSGKNESTTEQDFSGSTIGDSGTNMTIDWSEFDIATIILQPKYSDWKVEMFPGTTVSSLEGHIPNWFQRKMQELVFGFKWRK